MHPNRIAKFMRASSQLNKQPKVSTDFFDNPKLKQKGSINYNERVSLMPKRIPKKLAHQNMSSKFKGNKPNSPPPKKKAVTGGRYK